MQVYSKWASVVAIIAWLFLTILTAGGGFLEKGTLPINMAFATVFLCIGVFLIWRLRVMAFVVKSASPSEAMRSLFRVEAVSATAMMLLGLLLAIAAATRVLGERLPVFG